MPVDQDAEQIEAAKIISDRKLLIISQDHGHTGGCVGNFYRHCEARTWAFCWSWLLMWYLPGVVVPLTLGIYWSKANTPGALAAIIVGSVLRLYLFYNDS